MPSPRELWQDYHFLTKEMSKFLLRNDIDLFFELMNQREKIQADLDSCEDDYKRTPEGKSLLEAIRMTNQGIGHRLQFMLNQAKQQESVSNAYDGYGERPVGNRLDQKS
ncbi:MAG: hypothetical protein K0Q75_2871 [Anaerospora sp.]|jgi:hypothetical protein|nr:hypothetical protein [Anaerospora sp.]